MLQRQRDTTTDNNNNNNNSNNNNNNNAANNNNDDDDNNNNNNNSYTDLLHEALAAIEVLPDGRVSGKSELVKIFADPASTQRRFNEFRTHVLEECKAINQFRLGLCETAQNNARKIKWDDVELGAAAKNYEGDGKWLDVQGGR